MTLIIYRFYALIFKALTEIIENLELCDLEKLSCNIKLLSMVSTLSA